MLEKLSKIGLSILMVICLVFGQGSTVHAATVGEQMDTIKDRLKTYFLELDTIDDGAKVETCYVSHAEEYLEMMQEDGSFADVDYQSTQNAANGGAWGPYLALDRLQAIAIAYHKEGNALYHKKEVIVKLNQAILHWNSIKTRLSTTLTGPRSTNWWENQVGVQLRFSRIALFMEGIMSDDAMDIMLTKLREKTPEKYKTGQNNLWFTQNWVYHALITEDEDELKDMVTNYLDYCLLTQLDDNTAEAVQVDNSFYMHGRQFYSNGYGLSMFRDMSFWIYMLRETDFVISDEVMKRMADYMINGTSWTIRGDIMELYLGYRPYSYEVGYTNYASAYIDPLKRMVASDKEHESQYQAILDNITGKNSTNGKSGNYYMWRSTYASHMRDGYGVNVKMDSRNVIGGEWRGSWTGTNYGQLIYWTSSAASTITVDGDEYTKVFPVYDWAHCPGTTTPARIVSDFSNSGRFTNGTDHTIGVTDGTYGSTSYVMNKKDTQATKGYFFFDDEFVALGAGITSKESTAIHTTLNQCEANGVQVNGQSVVLGTEKEYQANYIYNDKVGYVFLDETDVNVSYVKKDQVNASLWDETKQEESSPVFMAYVDHGVKPSNASYAYIVVPNTTSDQLKTYAQDIPVTIVANTADVQAVRHDDLKQTQIHFYKAGSLEYKEGYTITVDQACNVMIDESGNTRQITVAVNDQTDHQTIHVQLAYGNTKTTTSFVSKALPYAGQSMTLSEGQDDRYQASSATVNHPITNIVDGDANTYWESDSQDEQWVSLFTGTDQFISSMNIQWGDHAAQEYDVYVSQDGVSYEKIQSITDGSDTVQIGAICHYIKIVMKSGSAENYQIKEVTLQPSKLLSQEKETYVKSTSEKDSGNVKEYAVDGDLGTRWSSSRNSDDEWITVNLGKKAKLDAIEIIWQAACSDNYQIEVSDDNENWTTVKNSLKTNKSLTDTIIFDETVEAKYVRVHSTKTRIVDGTNYGISIYEFKVYGEYKRAEENIALNKATETSSQSTQAPTLTGNLTVDGDKTGNSRWASLRGTDDNWITVDLGRVAEIDDIIVYWETSCSDNYQIEVSEDNENWETVQSNLVSGSGKNPIDKISFDKSVSARYVKIHSLKSRKVNEKNYGINIYEIEIFGIYTEEETPKVNMALNKATETSSVSTYDDIAKKMVGSRAVDGDKTGNSRWASLRGTDDNWITVDLGSVAEIDDIIVYWEGACSDNYQIEVSNDNENWRTVKTGLKTDASLTDKIAFDESVSARYVKIHSLKSRSFNYGINIYEIEVYGTYLPEENIALNKPATASSVYQGYTASRAFDGSTTGSGADQSRWVSNRESLDEWIYVDLQDYYNISKVVLNWEGACGKEYKLQVSTDGEHWEDIEHVTDGKAGIITFTYDEDIIARYVRMEGIEYATKYGYSLWEFEVYGDLLTRATLKAIYNQYEALDTTAYTPISVELFHKALEDVLTVSNTQNVSREDMVKALEQMKLAYRSLVEKANKDELKNVLDQVDVMDTNLYTPNSLEAFKEVLTEVQGVYDDQNATQAEVDAAVSKLQLAFNNLVEKADKDGLKTVIENAKAIEEDLYTPSSVQFVKDTLIEVEKVYENENASDEDVQKAIDDLTHACGQLKARADMTQLKKIIEDIEALDETLYTAESYKALQELVVEEKKILDNVEATQDEVDAAIKTLNEGIAQLVKVERTALKDLLSEVKGLDQTKYTDESVQALQEAIEKAEKAMNSNDQAIIDQAKAELIKAKEGLKAKPSIDVKPENPEEKPQPETPVTKPEETTQVKPQEGVTDTGDHNGMPFYGSLCMIALLGVTVLMKKRKD